MIQASHQKAMGMPHDSDYYHNMGVLNAQILHAIHIHHTSLDDIHAYKHMELSPSFCNDLQFHHDTHVYTLQVL